MNRRSFIAGILAAGVAPVFLGSKSPAGLFLPKTTVELQNPWARDFYATRLADMYAFDDAALVRQSIEATFLKWKEAEWLFDNVGFARGLKIEKAKSISVFRE